MRRRGAGASLGDLQGVWARTAGQHTIEVLVRVGEDWRIVQRHQVADVGAGFSTLTPAAQCGGGQTLWPSRGQAPRRQKFNARKTAVDGITFASAKEAARYRDLVLRLRAGEIRDLRLQPTFEVRTGTASGVSSRTGLYSADFEYVETATGLRIVEDVKGGDATRTQAYKLRKRAVEAAYGITISEV